MKQFSTTALIAILALLATTSGASAQPDFWLPSTGPFGGAIRGLATDSVLTVFAATDKGLYGVNLALMSWRVMNPTIRDSVVAGVAVVGGVNVVAGLASRSIYLSTDLGTTWSARGTAPVSIRGMVAMPDGRVLINSTQGVYSSSDMGATWSPTAESFPTAPPVMVNLEPATASLLLGLQILAGTESGLFASIDNGQTWFPADSGMTALEITSFATGPSGSLFAGDRNGLHRSMDGGDSWQPIVWADTLFRGPVESLAVLRDGSQYGIVFARFWDRIYRSTDNGLTWLGQPVATGDDNRHSVVAAPDGFVYTTGRLVNGAGSLIRSSNGGVSWVPAAFFDARNAIVAVDSVGVIAMYDGRGSLFVSSNNGVRWTLLAGGINPYALAFRKDGRLLIASYNTLYRAELVSPEVWRLDTVGTLPLLEPTTLSVTDKGALYVAGQGVYRSSDNGRTWTNVSSGLPVPRVNTIGYSRDGWVFAATAGGSVVRSAVKETGSDVTGIRVERSSLAGVSIEQLHRSTSDRIALRLALPVVATIDLELMTVQGEKVATAIEGSYRTAGLHDLEIDASALPSGIYLCRLTIDGESRVVKITHRR